MRALIYLLPLFVATFISYQAGRRSTGISRKERKELEASRDLRFNLASKAAEHELLGDHFATIVKGMLHDTRKELG